MSNTEIQYSAVIEKCFEIFSKKNQDYGTSWKILRLPSITDQIYIKAQRIRTIQENGFMRVEEGQSSEFMGIVNYCVMALIQMNPVLDPDTSKSYNEVIDEVKTLLFNKNHDYGEAWRQMRVSSMTDIILMKLLRIKQIEDNDGVTLISEGIKAGYQDIINYSIFCLIKLADTLAQQVQQ
jgi:Nucleotide modification associated domain 1